MATLNYCPLLCCFFAVATLLVFPAKTCADVVTFWDSTENTSVEALRSTLSQGVNGSSVFETLSNNSAYFDSDRRITSLTFYYALTGSWNTVDFRLGEVVTPLNYSTTLHDQSFINGYSEVINEQLFGAPSNTDWQTPIGRIGGINIYELTFSGLNFEVAANEDWTPILSPLAGPSTTFQFLATGDIDGFANINAFGGVTQRISDYGFSINTALVWKAEGFVVLTVLGDVNLDGSVTLLDVAPFVNRISTGTFQAEADINQDGSVDLLDVQPFIDLLTG